MPLHWTAQLEDLWKREEFKCADQNSEEMLLSYYRTASFLGLEWAFSLVWWDWSVGFGDPVSTAVVCSLLLWCSPQLTQHPRCCLMVCFPMCVLCRLPAALWGPRETYYWSHFPLSLCVWWSTQHVCMTGKSQQLKSGEVRMFWTNQFLFSWKSFSL